MNKPEKIFIETTQEEYDKRFKKDSIKIVDPVRDMEKSYLNLAEKLLTEDRIEINVEGNNLNG